MPDPGDQFGHGQLHRALPVPSRATAWERVRRGTGATARTGTTGTDEHEEQEDEERYLDGDLLDLEPTLRDAVVLALPMAPLCRDDCPGLCVECGVPLADAGPGHQHEDPPDPRWNGLKQFDDEATPDQPRRAGAIDLQEG